MDKYIYIANALLYIFLFLYIFKKVTNNGKYIVLLIIGILSVASICSILYFESPLYYILSERGNNNISFLALIYLFIGFVIYIYPLTKLNFSGNIIFPIFGKKDVVTTGIVLIGLLSILPFVENFQSVSTMSALDMADAYYEKQHEIVDNRSHLSAFGRICNGFVVWFRYITPVLFFYAIVKKKKWYVILLVSLSLISPVFLSLMTGGRGAAYALLTILVLNFLLFLSYFNKKTIKRVMRIVLVFGILLASLLIIMTFARSEGESDIAINQITRYIGEGWVNFAETGWYTKVHTEGHSIINGTGYTFMKEISDFFESRKWEELSDYTHMRMYVYYTVIGDFYIDFGLIGGLLFTSLLAFFFYKTVYKRPDNFSSLIIINLYAKLGLTGYGCFCYMNYAEFVLFTLVLYLLFRAFEPIK